VSNEAALAAKLRAYIPALVGPLTHQLQLPPPAEPEQIPYEHPSPFSFASSSSRLRATHAFPGAATPLPPEWSSAGVPEGVPSAGGAAAGGFAPGGAGPLSGPARRLQAAAAALRARPVRQHVLADEEMTL